MEIVSSLESLASRLTGKPVSITVGEEDPLTTALKQLLTQDWEAGEQMSLLTAMTNPRVELVPAEEIEGEEVETEAGEDDEPELVEVVVPRVNERSATAMIVALLTYVESDYKLFGLADSVLKDVREDAGLLSLAGDLLGRVKDYEGLQGLAKELVARVEKAKSEEAATLLARAQALKKEAAALEQRAANRADESAASAEEAANLGTAKGLL